MLIQIQQTSEIEYKMSWKAHTSSLGHFYHLPSTNIYAESPEELLEAYRRSQIDMIEAYFIEIDGSGVSAVALGSNSIEQDKIKYSYSTVQDNTPREATLEIEVIPLDVYNSLPMNGHVKDVSTQNVKYDTGLSSYYFTRYFMPKWSTAYKYPLSNHTKAVAPALSFLTSIPKLVDNLSKGIVSDPSSVYLPRHLSPKTREYLSNKDFAELINTYYIVDNETTLNFGDKYNTIYIEALPEGTPEVEVIISGLYKNSMIDCTVKLDDRGYISLPHKFSKIFNIKSTAHNIEKRDYDFILPIKISNVLYVEGFVSKRRAINTVRYNETAKRILVLNNLGDTESVFSFGNKEASISNIYVDDEDKIVTVDSKGIVSTGKLDSLKDGLGASDITCNNSDFIEVENFDNIHYNITVYIKNYVRATNTQRFQITISDSGGETLVLDEHLNLTDISTYDKEDIPWLYLHKVDRDYISIELEMDFSLTSSQITLSDWEGMYKQHHVILQPRITLTPQIQVPDGAQNNLVLLNNKLALLDDESGSITHLEED